MRYINTANVEANLPKGWQERAQRAHEEVRALSRKERSEALNGKGAVWRDLKDVLKSASNGKCWYCESRQERSDNAVDHYRPKNRLAECPDHEGYWWLAFEWSNYRYSCTFCNSHRVDESHGTAGGKHDHFPLFAEDKRAKDPNDSLDDEQPLLLDPACASDPPLLWFDEDGQPRPNPQLCGDESSYLYKRVIESVRLYHLDHVDTVESRKTLSHEISDIAEKADYYFKKYDEGDMTARRHFSDRVKELRDKLKPAAEYSAAAHATLMGLRGKSAIAEMVLAEA